jgi:hypothetical protein
VAAELAEEVLLGNCVTPAPFVVEDNSTVGDVVAAPPWKEVAAAELSKKDVEAAALSELPYEVAAVPQSEVAAAPEEHPSPPTAGRQPPVS